MMDPEKVIQALRQHIRGDFCARDKSLCPYWRELDCVREMCIDALELLERLREPLEPRVMTLEEIWEYGDNEPIFLEYVLPTKTFPTNTVLKAAIFQPDSSDDGNGDGYMCVVSAWCASGFYNRKEYGKTWRCWTARPTDEQRKAVKWDAAD